MPLTKLSDSELEAIEHDLEVVLPGLYRRFLTEQGYGTHTSGHEIYHPAEIFDLYKPFFDDPSQIFNPYFPFGADNNSQTIWVIDAETNMAAQIYHETVPDDWPDEDWVESADWISNILTNPMDQ